MSISFRSAPAGGGVRGGDEGAVTGGDGTPSKRVRGVDLGER